MPLSTTTAVSDGLEATAFAVVCELVVGVSLTGGDELVLGVEPPPLSTEIASTITNTPTIATPTINAVARRGERSGLKSSDRSHQPAHRVTACPQAPLHSWQRSMPGARARAWARPEDSSQRARSRCAKACCAQPVRTAATRPRGPPQLPPHQPQARLVQPHLSIPPEQARQQEALAPWEMEAKEPARKHWPHGRLPSRAPGYQRLPLSPASQTARAPRQTAQPARRSAGSAQQDSWAMGLEQLGRARWRRRNRIASTGPA